MIAVSIAVDYAFTGQRDVLLLECIDERRVVHQLHAFPASENQRQIFFRISIELDGRAFSNVQINVALQMNRSTREISRRHDDAAASGFVACFDATAKCICAISFAVSCCAKYRDVKISPRKDWGLNSIQNLRIEDLPGAICLRRPHHGRCESASLRQLRQQ